MRKYSAYENLVDLQSETKESCNYKGMPWIGEVASII